MSSGSSRSSRQTNNLLVHGLLAHSLLEIDPRARVSALHSRRRITKRWTGATASELLTKRIRFYHGRVLAGGGPVNSTVRQRSLLFKHDRVPLPQHGSSNTGFAAGRHKSRANLRRPSCHDYFARSVRSFYPLPFA
jgi:hypothetical protein